jgi:hypothetical protein
MFGLNVYRYFRHRRLIDPAQYDLRNLEGQQYFARAVIDAQGQYSPSLLYPLIGGSVVLGLCYVFLFRMITNSRVPRSIVAIRRYEQSSSSEEEPQ